MKTRRAFLTGVGGAAEGWPLGASGQQFNRILYLTNSAGYRHEVIPLSQAILKRVGENSGMFEVTATEDVSEFTIENLQRYDTVIFYTSGELPMSRAQKAALLDFVRSGHGFIGIHSSP